VPLQRCGDQLHRPGSPWQNPYVESFGGRLRDELLAVEAFTTLLEAQVLVEDWRIEYNTIRPHSALGYLTRPTTPRPGPPPTPELSQRMDQQPDQGHQQPADFWHGERQQAELTGQAAASPFAPPPVVAVVRVTTRKAWASRARVMCRYQPGQRRTS